MTDDHLALERVISDLPPRQRMAVDCYYYLDLSVAEPSSTLRTSPSTSSGLKRRQQQQSSPISSACRD